MSSAGGRSSAPRIRSAPTPAANGRPAGVSSDRRVIAEPIGIFRTPFRDPAEAPRQSAEARGVEGRIELLPGRGFEFAIEDLEAWRYLWVLFWFHRAETWRAKIRPPR